MKALETLMTSIALLALLAPVASAQVAPEAAPAAVADGPSTAPAPAAIPPRAMMLVDAIDIPLTPETVAAAGLSEAHAAALAADPDGRRYTRVRAVGALGVLGTPSARELVERLAVTDADELVRAQALVSLSRVWGRSDREAVVDFLTARLDDASPAVSDAIARELSRLYR